MQVPYTLKEPLLLVALGFFALLCSSVPAAASRTSDHVMVQKHTVVTVYVEGKEGKHIASETGFFVHSDGVVASSCRIIQRWLAATDNQLYVDFQGTIQFPMGEMISSRCVNGLVLFQVPGQGLPAVTLARNFRPRKGDTVYVASSVKGSSPKPIETTVKSVGDGQYSISQPRAAVVSLGSPVFNNGGSVIGIVVPTLKPEKGGLAVAPARFIEREVDRYRQIIKRLSLLPSAPITASLPSTTRSREDLRTPERIKALEDARKRVLDEPESASAQITLAKAFENLAMHSEALEAYRRAKALDPQALDPVLGTGLLNYRLGRYREAIDAYREATALNPRCFSCFTRVGGMYLILKEYPSAIEAYREALKLDQRNGEVLFNLGLAYYLNGDQNDAVAQYSLLKEIDKTLAERLVELMY